MANHLFAHISVVQLPGKGCIGMSACPGRHSHSSLTEDIQSIADWGASVVVTLMQIDELNRLGVSTLSAMVQSHNMLWLHRPIIDYSIPDNVFEAQWQETLITLRNALANNGRVFVHCRGGLGRTGLVVARLLIEYGWSPSAAIQCVRAVRPGSIETTEQEHYVLGRELTLSC